jgi:DNA-directed RNA polymerase II subunit RPB3
VPDKFYFEVESAGNLEPDAIIQQGIKVLQQKLAAVIRDMTGVDEDSNGVNGGDYGDRSPGMGMNGQGQWPDTGYTTPYGQNGGNAGGPWGNNGGSSTPYGATPYGQNGQSWP